MQHVVVTKKVGETLVVNGSAKIRIIKTNSQEVQMLIEATPKTKIRREARINPTRDT